MANLRAGQESPPRVLNPAACQRGGRDVWLRGARWVGLAVLAGMAVATLFWIALAYLQPGLRKAIIFAGFGLC